MDIIQGKVYIMGDDINTDDIVPSHSLTLRDACDMAQCACETIDPEFSTISENLNIIIAGENFGCGSSREEAVNVFKILGIKAIIAKSIARIYFRNLINLGIPGIILDWNKDDFSRSDEILISLEKGEVDNITKNKTITFEKLPPFLINILKKGGILNKIKETL
ncbi:MAG: 3-isopropylmalate dehydratase [Candidatus Lokiarchaeota archaeon]|nr:3-isopropylmalate dehydratase [Candidatus Lokiarchaeota archaeon]MBD3200607.1 3-isopropylmalate dehydratase [Candidatus Lokiarchaeota archaeon]